MIPGPGSLPISVPSTEASGCHPGPKSPASNGAFVTGGASRGSQRARPPSVQLPQVSSTCQMFPSGLGPLGAVGRVWLRPLGWRRKLGRGRGPDPGLSHGVTWSSEAGACWGSVGPGGGGTRSGTPGEDRARSPGPVPSPHSVQGPHGASGASKSGVPHLSWLLALPPALLSGGATWRERRCRQAPLLSLVVASGLCLWVPEWSLPLCEQSEQSGVVAPPAWSSLSGHCPPDCPWGRDLGAGGGHCSWTHSLDGASRGVPPPGCPSQGHRRGPHTCLKVERETTAPGMETGGFRGRWGRRQGPGGPQAADPAGGACLRLGAGPLRLWPPNPQFFVLLLLVFLLEASLAILFFAYTDKVRLSPLRVWVWVLPPPPPARPRRRGRQGGRRGREPTPGTPSSAWTDTGSQAVGLLLTAAPGGRAWRLQKGV